MESTMVGLALGLFIVIGSTLALVQEKKYQKNIERDRKEFFERHEASLAALDAETEKLRKQVLEAKEEKEKLEERLRGG